MESMEERARMKEKKDGVFIRNPYFLLISVSLITGLILVIKSWHMQDGDMIPGIRICLLMNFGITG